MVHIDNFTDNNYYKNKTYYQLIVRSENDKKIYKFSIKTTVNPKLKKLNSKKWQDDDM